MTDNIVIAGGGFAGVTALRHLHARRNSLSRDFKLIMIDSKTTFEFLPMLPDIIGDWCTPGSISVDLEDFCNKHACEFIKDEIIDIDLNENKLKTAGQSVNFEYLIIASGSKTNFYGNESAARSCYRLDTVRDAVKIRDDLLERAARGKTNVLVVGAGYTGIEIACNAHYLLKDRGLDYKITLLEKGREILPSIPGWIKEATLKELEKMDISVLTQDVMSSFEGDEALLASGAKISDAFCIWSAGVSTPDYIQKLPFEQENTRIRVNNNLVPEGVSSGNVFIAGNAACFIDRTTGKPLRMAVMFSIEQGKIAARNVIKSILKEPLSEYNPLDLGFFIPIANGNAFGSVLGMKLGGRPGYFLHYLMCVYRSEPEKRKLLLNDLMLKYKKKERRKR